MATDDPIDAQRALVRPFEDAEAALVRAIVSSPAFVSDADEAALRYALNLARTTRDPDARTATTWTSARSSRRTGTSCSPPPRRSPRRAASSPRTRPASCRTPLAHARAWRARLLAAFAGKLPASALDREVCEKALVLVCGGGGGVAWSYLGAFALLEQYGLVPRFLAGTSMGAVLLLFRARRLRWHPDDVSEAHARPLLQDALPLPSR